LSYKNKSGDSELLQGRLNRKTRVLTRAVLLVAFAAFTVGLAHAAQFSIDAVKAAYLFRFAQYVEWPEIPADAPFVFAVSGAEDVAVHLEHLLAGMAVNGRRAEVRRVTRAQELEGVQVLFVGPKVFTRTRVLRANAIQRPILIVTENQNGLDGGGVINFFEVNHNLRFEISLNAADRSKLKIDSALLSVAARVEGRPQAALNRSDGDPRLQRPALCGIRNAYENAGRRAR
jgi:uncharacterized protein DUF4154